MRASQGPAPVLQDDTAYDDLFPLNLHASQCNETGQEVSVTLQLWQMTANNQLVFGPFPKEVQIYKLFCIKRPLCYIYAMHTRLPWEQLRHSLAATLGLKATELFWTGSTAGARHTLPLWLARTPRSKPACHYINTS